ncbi:MAG: NAD-dependent epimerase/dehydratase family protein [Deltaproteobacteria bacterium]|nr:NAD-dependent epimerase/dehydratase family protein [Deltaproteobacteria bacterium]
MPDPSTPALPFRRWAVTGGTGLVGNNLVRRLVAGGADVRVLSRRKPRREFAGLAVEEVEGDVTDAASLERLCAGAECVVHAAALVEIRHGGRDEFERVNVAGTAAMLRAVPRGARLVHVSTVDALGLRDRANPADEDTEPRPHEGGVPYVDTKRAADRLVLDSDRDWVIVYPTYMLGPWDWRPSSGRMLLEVARGQALFAPPGGNNFVHIDDVVTGLLAAAGRPRGGRWILGNENLSYAEAWTLMAEVTGARKPLGTLPRWAVSAAVPPLHAARKLGLREGEINAAAVAMSRVPHYFSAERARAELGLPATPIRQAIHDAWTWFKLQGIAPGTTT